MAERAVHLTITGRVQGIGYRAWVENEAAARGLAGWVRNRRDGSVEAVFSGDAGEVDAMVAACHRGPFGARVASVIRSDYVGPRLTRFTLLPTE
jgi:acylphosphatase